MKEKELEYIFKILMLNLINLVFLFLVYGIKGLVMRDRISIFFLNYFYFSGSVVIGFYFIFNIFLNFIFLSFWDFCFIKKFLIFMNGIFRIIYFYIIVYNIFFFDIG